MNFLARRRASRKPSATSMISQISSKSGTTIAQGLGRSMGSASALPLSHPALLPLPTWGVHFTCQEAHGTAKV